MSAIFKTGWLPVSVALGLIALALGASAALCTRPSGPALLIQFLSNTNFNEPRLRLSAVFAVTNLNNRKITWIQAYPQARRAGTWPTVALYNLAASDLKRGEGELVILPVPRTGEAWRLPIVWSRVPANVLEHYFDYFHGVIWHTNYSDEIKLTGADPGVAPSASNAVHEPDG